MTSKRIAKKASKLGRTGKTYAEREVAMSDLSQAKRKKKTRKPAKEAPSPIESPAKQPPRRKHTA